jgi:hypothetical protein
MRLRLAAEDRIPGIMKIGVAIWTETAEALAYLHRKCARRGFAIHTFQFLPDRSIGLPPEMRDRAPKETDPMLADEYWSELG